MAHKVIGGKKSPIRIYIPTHIQSSEVIWVIPSGWDTVWHPSENLRKARKVYLIHVLCSRIKLPEPVPFYPLYSLNLLASDCHTTPSTVGLDSSVQLVRGLVHVHQARGLRFKHHLGQSFCTHRKLILQKSGESGISIYSSSVKLIVFLTISVNQQKILELWFEVLYFQCYPIDANPLFHWSTRSVSYWMLVLQQILQMRPLRRMGEGIIMLSEQGSFRDVERGIEGKLVTNDWYWWIQVDLAVILY